MLHKTKRVTLVEQVASQIESLIESGHWEVGKKIPSETELMKTFDVSRNTLREAIRALVHAGLLESKQGRGTIVRSSSALSVALNRHMKKTSLIDTLEVRLALEQKAASLAAKRRTNADLTELEQCIVFGMEALQDKDVERFIQSDISFHKMVVKIANNQLLYDLYDYMTDAIYASISDIFLAKSKLSGNIDVHRELFEAIRNQDSEKAASYVKQYITTLKSTLESVAEVEVE